MGLPGISRIINFNDRERLPPNRLLKSPGAAPGGRHNGGSECESKISMAYTCDLGGGQHVYLDNVGDQTAVTLASTGPGQQQQSGSQFTTGPWTQAPEFFRIDPGVVIKLTTAQGAQFLQLQGQQLGWMVQPPTLANAQQMQTSTVAAMPGGSMPPMQPMTSTTTGTAPKMEPMQPMQPMQPMAPMPPMQMGNMSMNTQPMEMRMGNMAMRMGEAPNQGAQRKFCSQCGTPVQPSDRFCASCGHQLSS
jgi:hypothetical protein